MIAVPISEIVLILLWAEMLALIIPMLILLSLTGEDFTRKWMVDWALYVLKKCGIQIEF